MEKVTLLRLYQLKVFCLVIAVFALTPFEKLFHLNFSQTVFAWVLISLAFEGIALGIKDIRVKKFVPDKKKKVSLAEVKDHFLTMRKAKIVFLGVSFVGMILGLPFHYSYLSLALGWTIYAYGVKEKKVASVAFEPRPLSKKEWEEMRDYNDPQNFPQGSRSSAGSGLSV